jgi:hypothetical protein
MKRRGNGRTTLSLRGKHRGDRLKARIDAWKVATKNGTEGTLAFHKPGSGKK